MRIDKSVLDDYAILTLKGEFDTFYVPRLQDEVEGLLEQGISHVILNLRLVKFINSTGLGAIIKLYKRCKTAGGELVLSKPSPFAKDVIEKLGINQLVSMHDDEDAAVKHVIKSLNAAEFGADSPLDEEKVLIMLPDAVLKQYFGGKKALLGTMSNVDGSKITFLWPAKKYGMSTQQAREVFAHGKEISLKFQVRVFKKGFFEVLGKVTDLADAQDNNIRVTAAYARIAKSDQEALSQFAADLAFLKRQIPNG